MSSRSLCAGSTGRGLALPLAAVLCLSASCQPLLPSAPGTGPSPAPAVSHAAPPRPSQAGTATLEFQDLHAVVAAAEGDGRVWLGTDGGGVQVFASTGGTMQKRLVAGLPSLRITSLALLGEGELAVGTRAGLAILRGDGDGSTLDAGLPPGSAVQALARTADGILWVGWSGGLIKLPPRAGGSAEHALRGVDVASLQLDTAGDLWVGTREHGLLHVAGEFAEQFGVHHGLATTGIADLITTNGGGVVAIGPPEEGGELISLYDGVQWYPLELEQPDAVWQIRRLAVLRNELLLLSGFGVRRMRQVVLPEKDRQARARVERFLASSWPRVVSREVPPPPPELLRSFARGEEVDPAAQPAIPLLPPEEELHELIAVPPPEELKQADALQLAFEEARKARAAYYRTRARQAALQAELGELESRRKAALEREAGLERRLAGLQAGAPPATDEQELLERDLEAARASARQSGVAYELSRSRLKEVDAAVGPLRTEALRAIQVYADATGGAGAVHRPAGAAAAAAATREKEDAPRGTITIRPAPFVERSSSITPHLVLEPFPIKPELLPGAITLWQGSSVRDAQSLWLGSAHRGAWRWTPEGFVHFAAGDLVPAGPQQGPLVDGQGNVWVVNAAGILARYDGARWSTEELPVLPGAAAGTTSCCRPQAIALDGAGRLALACSSSGRLRLLLHRGDEWQEGGQRQLLAPDTEVGVTAWAIDDDGRHWMSISRRLSGIEERPLGLLVLGPGDGEMVHHVVDPKRALAGAKAGSTLPADRLTSIAIHGRRVFVGTSSGLCRFEEGALRVFDENDGMESESVKDVVVQPGGEVWVATGEGCGRLGADDRWSFFHARKDGTGLPSNQVLGLAVDRTRSIWAATTGGLARWVEGRWEKPRLSEEVAASTLRRITFDEQGRAWLLLSDRLVQLDVAPAAAVGTSR